MTLPASGPLTLADIQTEFGGTNPISLNEYYAGGGLVPAGTSGTYGTVPSSGALSVQNFYGTSAVIPAYIEEVFSTYLYTGTGASLTINNGINLSANGGLVWQKDRVSGGTGHYLQDTVRGVQKYVLSNSPAAEVTNSGTITSFNSNGYTVGGNGNINGSGESCVSWTFQEKPKFFDIVTGSQSVAGNVTFNHNLGSVPGCIMVKATSNVSGGGEWQVYHRSLGTSQYLVLNNTDAASSAYAAWGGVAPTSTQFTIGYMYPVGTTIVAYLFAHDAGGFGLTGTDNVISCGSYTGSGGVDTVTLGYEPQWILMKGTNAPGLPWLMFDNMRGLSYTNNAQLDPSTSAAESSTSAYVRPTATGFTVQPGFYGTGASVIYIAIRRGPMKVPTSGTSVFIPVTANNSAGTTNTTNFAIDSQWAAYTLSGMDRYTYDRLRGNSSLPTAVNGPYLRFDYTNAEGSNNGTRYWTNTSFQTSANFASYAMVYWNWKRAPSFFDVVCYTGTGTSVNQAVKHNLTVQPQLLIVKVRSTTGNWNVDANVLNPSEQYAFLNLTNAFDFNGPFAGATATEFYATSSTNTSGQTFVAYLFATCDGVSKVGSYTGTGSTQTISCGFTGGARFVLIKRTDSTGNWWVWDTARGMVSGSDYRAALNNGSVQANDDWVYTTTGGFQIVTSDASVNASGGKYVFLAIA